MTESLLSVVLPCRNQEDHIAKVLETHVASLSGIGRAYELVVVPNACSDATPAIVREQAANDPRIQVVECSRAGWGRSVLAGLGAARGAVLCYANSARTDPELVPALLELYLKEGSCLAKARREDRGAPLREIASWLYNLEGRLLFGIEVGDVNGTPKILSRDLYSRLALFSEGDLLDLELVAKATRLRVPIVELPVRGFRRHGGASSTNLGSAWRMYTGAVRLRGALSRFPPSDA